MAGENLKILISAKLDTSEKSINQINADIGKIEQNLRSLKVKIEINDKILSSLNKFTEQMTKLSTAALNTGKVIQESINPDGSRVKLTYYDGLKGEFSKVEKAAKDSGNAQLKTLAELEQGYVRLNTQVKKYADGATKNTISTYQNSAGNGRVVTTDANNNVINYRDIENIQKFQQAQEGLRAKLISLAQTGKYTTDELRKIGQGINLSNTTQQLDQLKNRMSNMRMGTSLIEDQEKITQSLKKMYDSGLVNEKFFQNFNKVINSTKNVAEIEKVQNALQRVGEVSKNKNLQQSLLSQAQSLLGSNSKNLNTAGITNLVNDLKNLNPTATNATRELQNARTQLNGFSNDAETAHTHTMSFGNALKSAFTMMPMFMLANSIMTAPINALKDMTQRLIEIDTQMTDIRRVMDLPDFKFTELLQQSVDTADQLSSKLSDVLNIVGAFGRMGFDSGQLIDITKTAQVLQNISDLDANSAVDTLTSAMLNFNIAAKDSLTISDKLNEVDNHFAITTKDLSDGIRRAAATSKTFGVSLDDLVGYIAAIGRFCTAA